MPKIVSKLVGPSAASTALDISSGGTGATTAADARTNLGIQDTVTWVTNYKAVAKDPTGFTNSESIGVSYNSTTRKVTLTGTFEAYFQGVKITELVDNWESPAHADSPGVYYLYHNGSGFVFDTTPWAFDYLQIAFVKYGTPSYGIRETHGFIPHDVHKIWHLTNGTVKLSGGDITNIVVNSTTADNRRPIISATVVMDEDLESTITTLTSKTYTQKYLTNTGPTVTYVTGVADIIPLNVNVPYYNLNTAGSWSQEPFPVNAYGAVFLMAIPTTSDAGSLTYRYQFIQPQQVSTTLSVIQALTPSSLVLGDTTSTTSEYVFIAKFIVRYSAGNWTIISVDTLSGTKVAQVAVQAGNYLTAVTTDTSLTGDGTPGNPLVVATPMFKTISVSGQSDVVADSNADTLTLIAGSNVTLETNTTNDSITINATGEGSSPNLTLTTLTLGNYKIQYNSGTDKLEFVYVTP